MSLKETWQIFKYMPNKHTKLVDVILFLYISRSKWLTLINWAVSVECVVCPNMYQKQTELNNIWVDKGLPVFFILTFALAIVCFFPCLI